MEGMTLADATAVFEKCLPNMFAGSNYIIDSSDGAVFEANVLASGGIWFVKEFRPGDERYEDALAYARARRDTLYKPMRK